MSRNKSEFEIKQLNMGSKLASFEKNSETSTKIFCILQSTCLQYKISESSFPSITSQWLHILLIKNLISWLIPFFFLLSALIIDQRQI